MSLEALKAKLAHRVKRIASDRRAAQKLRDLIAVQIRRTKRGSMKGAQFIADFEGFSPIPTDKLDGYSTVGVGHLIAMRPCIASDFKMKWVKGQKEPGRMSKREATQLLKLDLTHTYEPAVRELFENQLKGRFTQNRFDSVQSFVYNLGVGAIQGAHGFETMTRAIKSQNIGEIADALLLYDHGPNGPLPGLTRRRRCERRLFLSGNYSTEI